MIHHNIKNIRIIKEIRKNQTYPTKKTGKT